ncbi:hypothetical protein C8J57DRAFT_1554733 [Mycena rebaudengoi]|nr:hypothetical protein C8J57DRAFT_1554733 [Mycena rebaudengoi]
MSLNPDCLLGTGIASVDDDHASQISKYPILTLPTDITTEIFLHFIPAYPECSPLTGPLSPTFLGHICRTWRDMAFSTPLLWRAIGLWGLEHWEVKLHVLSIWLARSRTCPLSIFMTYYGGQGEHDSFDFTRFLNVMIPHSARWEHIDLILPFEVLRMIGTHFPLLRYLALGPTDPHTELSPLNVISPFGNAPRLTRVDLSYYFDPFTIVLPFSQLTSISAHLLTTSQCAEVLRQADALVEFKSDLFMEDENISALHMKHLQSLKLGNSYAYNSSPSGQVLLDALTAPALRFLKISECLFPNCDPIPSVDAFVARSGCKLTALKIIQALAPEMKYRAAFRAIELVTVKRKVGSSNQNSDPDQDHVDEEQEE